MEADIQTAKENLSDDKEQFSMKVGDKFYKDRKEAGTALVQMCREMKSVDVSAAGEYAGFKMSVSFESFYKRYVINLEGQLSHKIEIKSDPLGNIARISHALESMPKQLAEERIKLENVERQLETAKKELEKPFPKEQELNEKIKRLTELDIMLSMEPDKEEMQETQKSAAEKNEKAEASCKSVIGRLRKFQSDIETAEQRHEKKYS